MWVRGTVRQCLKRPRRCVCSVTALNSWKHLDVQLQYVCHCKLKEPRSISPDILYLYLCLHLWLCVSTHITTSISTSISKTIFSFVSMAMMITFHLYLIYICPMPQSKVTSTPVTTSVCTSTYLSPYVYSQPPLHCVHPHTCVQLHLHVRLHLYLPQYPHLSLHLHILIRVLDELALKLWGWSLGIIMP